MPDQCSKAGSQESSHRIHDYWLSRGGDVYPRVVRITGLKTTKAFYGVRSDLLNGLPQFWIREDQA